MKITIFSLTVLTLFTFCAETTYARNVKLILPIAAALEAKDIPDRPTGAVKFFFGGEISPAIQTKLGSYVAAPRTGAAGKSDVQACNEALMNNYRAHSLTVNLEQISQQE